MRPRAIRVLLSGLLALALAGGLAAQPRPGVHPISGRRFAPVMGYQGAEWLERGERDEEEAPDVALNVLKIAKGASVADIVQPQMLEMLSRRLASKRIANVTLVQGSVDDPKLAPASVDLALMVDV